jgi:hypothetical protein
MIHGSTKGRQQRCCLDWVYRMTTECVLSQCSTSSALVPDDGVDHTVYYILTQAHTRLHTGTGGVKGDGYGTVAAAECQGGAVSSEVIPWQAQCASMVNT